MIITNLRGWLGILGKCAAVLRTALVITYIRVSYQTQPRSSGCWIILSKNMFVAPKSVAAWSLQKLSRIFCDQWSVPHLSIVVFSVFINSTEFHSCRHGTSDMQQLIFMTSHCINYKLRVDYKLTYACTLLYTLLAVYRSTPPCIPWTVDRGPCVPLFRDSICRPRTLSSLFITHVFVKKLKCFLFFWLNLLQI